MITGLRFYRNEYIRITSKNDHFVRHLHLTGNKFCPVSFDVMLLNTSSCIKTGKFVNRLQKIALTFAFLVCTVIWVVSRPERKFLQFHEKFEIRVELIQFDLYLNTLCLQATPIMRANMLILNLIGIIRGVMGSVFETYIGQILFNQFTDLIKHVNQL